MRGLICSIAVVFLSAPLLFAQDPTWSSAEWEVSGFAGGSFGHTFQFPTGFVLDGLKIPQFSRTVGMRFGSGYQVGARVTQNLDDYWEADLEYTYANQPLRLTNLSPTIQSLSLSQSNSHFSYNISYRALDEDSRFRPYGKVGAGATLFHLNDRNQATQVGLLSLRDSWKFTMNVGGGFKYLLLDEAVLTFDVKDFISGVPTYGLPPSATIVDGRFQPGLGRRGTFNNWQINFGIGYRWNDW